jgi:L,D-transpeptidase catalytic domain/Putative peptidoglycan binding domain
MSAMRARRILAALTICLVTLAIVGAGAIPGAAATTAVTLTASDGHVRFGEQVVLTATIDPAVGGEAVAIVDADGHTVASGVTGPAGRFKTKLVPRANLTLHASSGGHDSAPVTVLVRPRLTLHVGTALLYGNLPISGRFRPARAGQAVRIQLRRAGVVVATKKAEMGAGGRFATSIRLRHPGTFRVRAFLDAADLQPARTERVVRVLRLPDLSVGSRGPAVGILERRLVELHYHLVGIDGVFDHRTADAVMAFRKVQRMPRAQTVTAAVWRALARPKAFVPRDRSRRFHIEVDQTRQVLATVRNGRVAAIFHVSTGKASTPTRDGRFQVFSKLAGFSPKRLFYPSFFDGQRAIHGWTDVPSYPASHGCVRVPYWIAIWIFHQADYGTPVLVYH